MASRTVKVVIGADITGLQSKMKAAAGSVKDFSKNTSKYLKDNEQDVSTLSSGLVRMGALGVAAAGLAVKRFADFDAQMSSVKAATMETTSNMELLRQAAMEAGADTQYSATEAAQGVEELAKAGVSTADILAGGLTGALDLAASGAMGVGEAAEVTASTLNQFGLAGNQASHVADLLAAGAGKAMGEVSDMAGALNQSGLVANQFGLSVEETVGTLTAFAKAGMTGSDAGTSLRTMLLRLANPTEEVKTLMGELGISAYDSTGKFVGLEALAGQLQSTMGGLSQEQRDTALAMIFGQDAIRGANILYSEGARGIKEYTTAVDDTGYAAQQAAILTDNLKGDIERLGGALDTVLIQSGSGANDVLRKITQGAEATVEAFGRLPEPILNTTTMLAGAGGLAAVGVGGMGKLLISVNNVKAATDGLKWSFKATSLTAGAVGAAIGVGALALATWAQNAAEAKARTDAYVDTLDALGRATDSTISQINTALSADNRNWAEKLFGDGGAKSLIDDAEKLGLSVDDLTEYITGNKGSVDKLNAAWAEYSTQAESSSFDFYHFKGALDDQADSLTNAQKQALQKAQADKDAGVASEEAASSTETATSALATYGGALADGTATVEDYTNALQEQIDTQNEAAGVQLSLSDAQIAYQQALADATAAIAENGQTLDITTEAGRNNRSELNKLAKQGWDVVTSMNDVHASTDDMRGAMQAARDDFISTAKQMGMNQEEAEALADKYRLIPDQVDTEVVAETAEAEARIANINRIVKSMPDGVVTISTAGYAQTYQYLMNIQGAISSINGSKARVAMGPGGQGGITYADGGVVDFFANGAENHVAQVAPAGALRVWAEQETGGEAYIPLAEAKRNRSLAILTNVADRFGYGLQKFADGGTYQMPAHYSQPSAPTTRTVVQEQGLPKRLVLSVGDREFTAYVDERSTRMAQEQQKRWARVM